MKIPPLIWGLVGAGVLVTLVVFLTLQFPGSLADQGSQISLTYSLLMLTALIGAAVMNRRFKGVPVIRYATIWVMLGVGIFTVYSFRDEAEGVLNRLQGELLPQTAQVDGETVIIRMASNGHFLVNAQVDGTTVLFLVDTGASDTVISPADAKRLGFDLTRLKFSKTYYTANGSTQGAPVKLNKIAIGPLVLRDVRASVNSADMGESLLGMSFLRRLSGYEVQGNSLILRP